MDNEETHRITERIVNLTQAQKVTGDHLDQIDETLDALDRVLRGDYENSRDGLVSRFGDMEHQLRKINAILFKDATGKAGLLDTVDALISGRMDAVERRKSTASVVIAIITSIALVLTNIDRIGNLWTHITIKHKAETLKARIKHRTRHVEPEPEPDSESQ